MYIRLFTVLIVLSGCDNSSTEAPAAANAGLPPAHCDAISSLSVCIQYDSRDAANASCPDFKGQVSDGACPTEQQSGSCAHDGKVRNYYKSGGSPQGTSYAERHCTQALSGTFTAP
ncbi:MAG: hypothetical protein AAFV53_14735 [Myxococcota bacterium]